ncbi:MAG TPA: DUF885 domain-containing protein [Gemmatimonadaceae bacterium]|nr:DUF885 domain-containing protein [Gemmatimonadaceae bacterium]
MFIWLALITIASSDSTPSQRLAALADRVWEETTRDDGLTRLRYGLPVDRLPDVSEQASQRDAQFWRSVADQVRAIADSTLSHDELVTKATLTWRAARGIEAAEYYWFTSFVTPYSAPVNGLNSLFRALPVQSQAHRDNYLRLTGAYADLLRALRVKLEGQVSRGLVPALPDVEVAIPLWRSYHKAPREHALWVAPERLGEIGAEERGRFEKALEAALSERVNPAFAAITEYLEGPYRAAAPKQVGLAQYANGKDYYRYLVRWHTTTGITPEALFQIGERELDSLRRELDRVRQQVGFSGSLAAFQGSLRTDPRYFAKTPEEVGARLTAYAATMEPKLDSLFSRRPKAPYGVERLARELEPTMTYGYYDAPVPHRNRGVYFYNGSKLEERNLGMAEGLTYHELAPGHHFQFALQRENTALPKIRREAYFTAHGEGWGDYASMLGADAGLYRDPYSRAGRLMMEMMLASRLVLDVGMNYFGWSLERARQFMRENTIESETQIASETLRYGVDIPGQALAYRMGSLTIRRIREDAKRALGPKWDVRAFHDLVLMSGPMPLDVLEEHVKRWTRSRG